MASLEAADARKIADARVRAPHRRQVRRDVPDEDFLPAGSGRSRRLPAGRKLSRPPGGYARPRCQTSRSAVGPRPFAQKILSPNGPRCTRQRRERTMPGMGGVTGGVGKNSATGGHFAELAICAECPSRQPCECLPSVTVRVKMSRMPRSGSRSASAASRASTAPDRRPGRDPRHLLGRDPRPHRGRPGPAQPAHHQPPTRHRAPAATNQLTQDPARILVTGQVLA